MKSTTIYILLLLCLLGCGPSKKVLTSNAYRGLIFYSGKSSFLVFYPLEKIPVTKKKIIKSLDNQYGNRVWFSESKYRFALEDMLPEFDTLSYLYLENPTENYYSYVVAYFNKPIESKLMDSVNREKAYKYQGITYDQFFIDDRDLKIDTLIFVDKKSNEKYLELLKKHKNSRQFSDPPLP